MNILQLLDDDERYRAAQDGMPAAGTGIANLSAMFPRVHIWLQDLKGTSISKIRRTFALRRN